MDDELTAVCLGAWTRGVCLDMPLWKRLWLLFTVIWVVVAALNVLTIVAFGDNPPDAVIRPLALMVGVPVLAYAIACALARLRQRSEGKS